MKVYNIPVLVSNTFRVKIQVGPLEPVLPRRNGWPARSLLATESWTDSRGEPPLGISFNPLTDYTAVLYTQSIGICTPDDEHNPFSTVML